MSIISAIDAPLLVFGGPYSNLEATRAVLAEALRRRIPADRIVCTGDVVAYGGDPAACVDLVREAGIHVVMGNCEEQIFSQAPDCGCGYAPDTTCDTLSRNWYAQADAALNDDARAWMGALPRRLDLEMNGLKLTFVHGSLNAINRFVFASTPARVKARDIESAGADAIIGGHSGLPFSQIVDGKLWHNPGAIGMPANDGTPRVWFSILSPGARARALVIEHVALAYDHAAAAASMRAKKLPEEYAAALETGVWPSCDVLPAAEQKQAGKALAPGRLEWRRMSNARADAAAWPFASEPTRLAPGKFANAARTASGEARATVGLEKLETLWINTGTLCNLACANCYIESTPRNDRLEYISAAEVAGYLDEIARDGLPTRQIGFTGGEPFMNRALPAMLEDALSRGFQTLVLTNAMKPMRRFLPELVALREKYGEKLAIRVSIDHYTQELHELERGKRSWKPTIEGLRWLADGGFRIDVAGRLYSGEVEGVVRAGYARLFAELGVKLDAFNPVSLVLFPEMDARVDVPEITESCWSILDKSPADIMCSSSRMVVKRKGASSPAVLACTLIAYDPAFELGNTLAEAAKPVALNHPHCAKFCVLGGAACSR